MPVLSMQRRLQNGLRGVAHELRGGKEQGMARTITACAPCKLPHGFHSLW